MDLLDSWVDYSEKPGLPNVALQPAFSAVFQEAMIH
jgi:hypothetical protein